MTHPKIMLISTVLVAAQLSFAGFCAMAADIVKLPTATEYFDHQFVDTSLACTSRLDGEIKPGDLKKFIKNASHLICLNSKGGSLKEALEIAAYMKKKYIATKIEAGARCESACALIFMAGTFYANESGSSHWRVLDPLGKLGFHAPALNIKDGNYDSESVIDAYDLALKSVSRTIYDLILTPRRETGGFDETIGMKASLLARMLETPSRSMFYIETVDHAGRWDIQVGPSRHLDKISDKQFKQACVSYAAWAEDKTAIDTPFGNITAYGVTRKVNGNFSEIAVVLSEMHETGCTFSTQGKVPTTRKQIYGKSNVYTGVFFAPETRLASLAPDDAKSENGTEEKVAFGTCKLFKNGRQTDNKPCVQSGVRRGSKVVETYTLPSGAKTVVAYQDGKTFINGNPTTVSKRENQEICLNNSETRTLFCYLPGN